MDFTKSSLALATPSIRAALATVFACSCSSGGPTATGFGQDAGGASSGSSGGSASSSSGNGSGSGSGSGSSGSGGSTSSSGGGLGSSGGKLDAGGSTSSSSGGSGGSSGSSSGGVSDGGSTCGGSVLGGGPLTTTATHLDIGVHDPSMIWDGSRYYLFATGGTLNVRSSADLITWRSAGSVLPAVPSWVTTAIGTTPTSLWAPDISYFNGVFHVYYSGSTFGSNTSVIGLATSSSLQSPTWTDHGLIVQTKSTDNFNAIDPNVAFDENCTPWLAFGSFWTGIKLRKLDAATGQPATDDTTTYPIATRPNAGGAVEASSIISHNGYYYLFASFDACCKGVSSTYNTNVGRATKITGPYVNKAGTSMTQGGAELLLSTSGRYIGPGGGTAWKNGNNYLYVYHYYDGQANGASKLQVRPVNFDAGDWVTLGDPLFP